MSLEQCHFNPGDMIHDHGLERLYLNMPMEQYEYIPILIHMIPPEFMDKYELHVKVYNGAVCTEVRKGMYGLPQAGKKPTTSRT